MRSAALRRLAAIHQPNFFPWLGYFDKIARCDAFVVLDSVQYQKTGGTWMNRVALLVGGEKRWVTAPILRRSGTWAVREARFQPSGWRETIRKTIRTSYGRSPRFEEVSDFLVGLLDFGSDGVAEYNLHAIAAICERLGIDFRGKAVMQSSLGTTASSTDLLVEAVRKAGCGAYLCGGGAGGYQEDARFAEAGIELVHQDFVHPAYGQFNAPAFVPGLSVIDALMNEGFDGTARLLSRRASDRGPQGRP